MPQQLIQINGRVVWEAEYNSYGNVQVRVKTVENPLCPPGQYADEETGLYYNLHRYYDPKIGRYTQTDPAGDGLNPYLYAAANPVNAIDPNGLCALRMVGGLADIGAGVGLVGVTSGWGSVVAWGLIANGFDNLIAGARSLDGTYRRAFLESAIHAGARNDLATDILYAGTQLGLGYAGIKADRLTSKSAKFYSHTGPGKEMPSTWRQVRVQYKAWRRGKLKTFKAAIERVKAHRSRLVQQWAQEAGFSGNVKYLHTDVRPFWRPGLGGMPPGDIFITRMAWYNDIGSKSIFYHELGHGALMGGGEAAATRAGIQWAKEMLSDPAGVVSDLSLYLNHLQ